jgi:hypothetical protein
MHRNNLGSTSQGINNMNANTNIRNAAACFSLIALSCIQSAHGQTDTGILPGRIGSSVQRNDGEENPLNFSTQKGTAELQLKVLKTINYQLSNGSLDPEKASAFKSEIDRLNDRETGYRSLGNAIPLTIVEKNSYDLDVIAAKLHRVPAVKTAVANSLHGDVDSMISRALAQNRISSGEAEKYYLRLTHIESTLESAKTDKESGQYQAAAMNKSLAELRSDISRH